MRIFFAAEGVHSGDTSRSCKRGKGNHEKSLLAERDERWGHGSDIGKRPQLENTLLSAKSLTALTTPPPRTKWARVRDGITLTSPDN